MKHIDQALRFQYPRLLAAIYFGLLSVVGTILTNAFLDSLGVPEAIPVFQSVLLGMVVAALTGALFGEQIIHCKKPYKTKTFWLGFIMVIASLPVFTLGLVYFIKQADTTLFTFGKFHHVVYFYFMALFYSYLLYGILLAIASGLAAMYLRGRMVYDVMYTHERQQQPAHAPRFRKKHKVASTHKLGHSHR